MKDLIRELIPHAPHLGLYVAPRIPKDKLQNALKDYAPTMQPGEVIALYDATLMGGGRDGAVFAADRFIFQNNDLEPAHEVRYDELVRVEKTRGFLKGVKIEFEVNRGRATFTLKLDASFKPEALDYLHRLLHEAMLLPPDEPEPSGAGRTAAGTDRQAVRDALDALLADGLLAEADYRRLLDTLG